MKRVALVVLAVVAGLAVHSCGDGGDGGVTPPARPPPNRAPVAASAIASAEVVVGETHTVNVSANFSDPDGDALTYTATSSNTAIASVVVAGTNVTVTALARGDVVVTVAARDPGGLSGQQTFAVTVPNRAPVATAEIPESELVAGDTLTVDMSEHFNDPDGDQLTYSATSSHSAVAAVAVSGSTVTIEAVRAGSAVVAVTARDPGGLSAQQEMALKVSTEPGHLHVHLQQDQPGLGAVVLRVDGPGFDSLRASPGLTMYSVPSPQGIRVFVAGPILQDGALLSFWTEDLGSARRYAAYLEEAAAKTYEQRHPGSVTITVRR